MDEDIQSKLHTVLRHQAFAPSAIGVTAFLGGLGIGYILGKRGRKVVIVETYTDPKFLDDDDVLEEDHHVDSLIEEELTDAEEDSTEEVRALYVVEETTEEADSGESFQDVAARFVEDRIQRTIETRQGTPAQPEVVAQNVFTDDDDDWDYEKEVANRTTSKPYVIHRDEFFEDSEGYAQITLTYYAGDDILVDEEDSPIYNFSSVVGPFLFGHGSGDPNVFYVRNDKRRAEYEILRHEGMYSLEVLGLEIEDNMRVKHKRERELRHSRFEKFRPE